MRPIRVAGGRGTRFSLALRSSWSSGRPLRSACGCADL